MGQAVPARISLLIAFKEWLELQHLAPRHRFFKPSPPTVPQHRRQARMPTECGEARSGVSTKRHGSLGHEPQPKEPPAARRASRAGMLTAAGITPRGPRRLLGLGPCDHCCHADFLPTPLRVSLCASRRATLVASLRYLARLGLGTNTNTAYSTQSCAPLQPPCH